MSRNASWIIPFALLAMACGVRNTTPAPTATQISAPPAATPRGSTTSLASGTVGPPAALRWDPFTAAPVIPPLPVDVVEALDRALASAVGPTRALGAAASVIVGPRGTWSGVAGHSRDGAAVTAASTWQTGSIAKTVVAAQILRLVERGRLRLEDPVSVLLPAGPGLDTNGASVADLLRMRSGMGLHVPPGTAFEYRNEDYVLLGRVIAAVEGRALGQVLTGDILAVPGAEALRFPENGTVENAAGPFDADAPSVARWGYELFGRRLVTDESLARMVDFDEGGYGMGVFDFSVDFGELAIGHLGQEPTWSAALVVIPSRQTAIAVLMNSDDVISTETVAIELARRLGG